MAISLPVCAGGDIIVSPAALDIASNAMTSLPVTIRSDTAT